MAGIKRFITYIYAYEDGKKGINTGFAKIEIRGKECHMEIHLRGVSMMSGNCKVGLFTEKEGEMLYFPMGEVRIMNRNGDYGTIIKADQIGASEYTFAQMEGLVFQDEAEQVYMTRWVEGNAIEVKKERIKRWEPPQLKGDALMNGRVSDEKVFKEDTAAAGNMSKEDIHVTEMPMRNIFPKYSWQDTWERLKQTYPSFEIEAEETVTCVRVELKDLRELPRKYWYLGNNSFLLHGFFNYHYFILGRFEEDKWIIGVPGIYQQQERVMAAIFGFPEFLTADEKFRYKENGGMEPVNYFGYWYHLLDE